jgi:multiple sugar transport system substrate-binding protein
MERKKIGRRDFLRLSAGAAAGAVLAGCKPQVVKETVEVVQTVEVEKEVEVEKLVTPTPARDVYSLPNAATGMPYEIKPSINNGEPIEFDYWEWALDRSDYEIEWVHEYMNIYPNVTINLVTQGWDDHFTKMMVSAPAGEGPAFFHMHTNMLTEFCDGGLMDSMPDYVASQIHLDGHWTGFREGAFDCPGGSGQRYFIPMGAQMPLLFINRRLWEEAGLTDDDVPKSWEELRSVAKALTKYDDAGRITQAGFQIGPMDIWMLNGLYQQGRYAFTKDRKRAQLDNEEAYNTVKFIQDLYQVDKVIDVDFPGMTEAFSSELTAIGFTESWFASVVRRNNPDLDWFPALMPTYTGSLEPAIGRLHFAVEAIVNAYAPVEVKKVAWDFWHFLYSNDERLVRTISLRNGMVPAYDKLQRHPAVKADPFANVVASGLDHGIVIAEKPAVWSTTVQQFVWDPVLLGEMEIRNALQAAQEEADAQLAQREAWNILERNYKHDDMMIPNQP